MPQGISILCDVLAQCVVQLEWTYKPCICQMLNIGFISWVSCSEVSHVYLYVHAYK